jgi:divalent metal cation (Fe/Co/Zn/Cd) transporter
MFFFQEGFTYRNFLMDALAIFIFVVWFWLLITVFADLFRRHDISGWTKAIWVIALIVFSYIAVLAYLIFQGRGWQSAMCSKLSRRVMSLGAWLVSALQMKSKSSMG